MKPLCDTIESYRAWSIASKRERRKRGGPRLTNIADIKFRILTGFVDLGVEQAGRWYAGWRMFFIVCSETFAFNNGNEWFVSHYLFAKK